MSARDAIQVEQALRKTAQLRHLTLSLRWASEGAARERLLSGFDSFLQQSLTSAQGSNPVPLPSVEALLAGIRACWARGDYATMQNVAGLLPRDLFDRHILLRAYVTAAADSAHHE